MKKLGKGVLLNKVGFHSTAAASYHIDNDNHHNPKTYDTHFSIRISDYNSSISLEFDFSTRSEKSNSLFKIKKLREILDSAEKSIIFVGV